MDVKIKLRKIICAESELQYQEKVEAITYKGKKEKISWSIQNDFSPFSITKICLTLSSHAITCKKDCF